MKTKKVSRFSFETGWSVQEVPIISISRPQFLVSTCFFFIVLVVFSTRAVEHQHIWTERSGAGGLGEGESGKTSAPSASDSLARWWIYWATNVKWGSFNLLPIKIFNKLFFVFIVRHKTFTDETSNRLGLCDMYYTYSTDYSISTTHFRKLVY